MNVAKFFDELFVVPDIEVIVALLPEVFRNTDQPLRHSLLQRFDHIGKGARSFPTQANRGLEWGTIVHGNWEIPGLKIETWGTPHPGV